MSYTEAPAHEPLWVSADEIPELYEARLASDHDAAQMLDARMQHLREGEWTSVPYAIDPLSTAALAVEARDTYGLGSPEYARQRQGIVLDCARLLAEAHRKLSWEYFPPLVQQFDASEDSYVVNGRSLMDIVDDGITPLAEPEELGRRVAERREEVTYRSLGRAALSGALGGSAEPGVLSVLTVSECPEWAIENAERNPFGTHGGYAPEVNKFMIRSVVIDQAAGVRYEEQLALKGMVIGHDDIISGLRSMNVVAPQEAMSRTDVLGRQIISRGVKDVFSLARIFDNAASERLTTSVFMGEVVADIQACDYSAIPAESADRQQRQAADAEALADYTMELAAQQTDASAAEQLVAAYVKDLVFAAVKNSPEQAAIAFDEATADLLAVSIMERNMGNYAEAERLQLVAEISAPPVVFCGAGTCGLESISIGTALWSAAKSLGLDTTADGEFLTLTGASCRDCGKRAVLIGANGKACGGCGYSEINGVLSGGKKQRGRRKSLGLLALAA